MAYLSLPDPSIYRQAVRAGLARWYTVDASLAGVPVEGATGLRPVGGSVTDTSKPGVRRTLNLELAGGHELYDLLAPSGTTLTATGHVRYTGRAVVDIPLGVFDVNSQKMSESDGRISLTADDRWGRIQRARFVKPQKSTKGLAVVQQIAALIRGALGADETVVITATSGATVGVQVWERDRDKAIIDLATTIGAWVYFDRLGVATVADVPTVGGEATWLVDAGKVLTGLDRERDRTDTRNLIVVSSSASDGERFPPQYVWDGDPSSPTYAGADPVNDPGSAGPFGIVPMFYDTPVLRTAAQARAAGRTILARSVGLASQVSLGQVPNLAVDAMDVMDVLPPGWRTVVVGSVPVDPPAPGLGTVPLGVSELGGDGVDSGGFGTAPFGSSAFGSGSSAGVATRPVLSRVSTRAVERHVADTVTHPLTVDGEQSIDGRSTRYELIDGGS